MPTRADLFEKKKLLHSKVLLWTVSMGFFMLMLDATIVNIALPQIARSVGASPFRIGGIVVVYALTVAVVVPISGWIAQRFGVRPMYSSAAFLFAAGSLLCASAHTLDLLLAGRGVQGIGGALLLSVGRLAILQTFEGEQRVDALSFAAIPGLMGPVLGPVVGGWLVAFAFWHWIFLVNVPIGLIGAVVAYSVLPQPSPSEKRSFDLAGYVLIAVAMVSVSFSLEMLNALRHPQIAAATAVLGIVAVGSYVWHMRRAVRPLFSFQLLRQREFAVSATACLIARTANGAISYLIPLFLQVIQKRSTLHAGFMMLPPGSGWYRLETVYRTLAPQAGSSACPYHEYGSARAFNRRPRLRPCPDVSVDLRDAFRYIWTVQFAPIHCDEHPCSWQAEGGGMPLPAAVFSRWFRCCPSASGSASHPLLSRLNAVFNKVLSVHSK